MVEIIVPECYTSMWQCSRRPHAVMDAGMDESVVDDVIARLREVCQQGSICVESAVEEQCRRRTKVGRESLFQLSKTEF
jgi:hypothetical protein